MFGMGLGELILVAIVAIIFLGPEKLPNAMVETAKFFRKVKKSLTDAKGALDEELKLSELKSDALTYKEKIENETKAIMETTGVEKSGREVKDLFSDLSLDTPSQSATPVSFEKKDSTQNSQPKA
ncbi:MAG: Sec-independent protein translocase protein TatB [Campylobacterales bacterium]